MVKNCQFLGKSGVEKNLGKEVMDEVKNERVLRTPYSKARWRGVVVPHKRADFVTGVFEAFPC